MFHTRLSDGVLEDLSVLGIELMDRELTTRKDCEEVAQILDANKGKMDAALYSDCMAELREIIEDRKWLASRTGRRVMEIEHWLAEARQMAKECFPLNDIIMGRDMMEEPDNLTIGIVARTREECMLIQKTIEGWQPPVSPKYKVYLKEEQ
jgi:hypothetical protein